ncbi:MAG: hypothetical protein IKK84_01610 [Clostridia bacterium]|nr:hypothetical protein [Clostridia bacterium]
MNNMLNSNLLNMLAGVDKEKLEQVSNIVKNMSKDDLNNLVRMLGMNNNNSQQGQNNN